MRPVVIRRVPFVSSQRFVITNVRSINTIKKPDNNERDVPDSWTISQSFTEWAKGFNKNYLKQRQDELMKFSMPYYGNQIKGLSSFSLQEPYNEQGQFLNEIRVENNNDTDNNAKNNKDIASRNHIVMLHGYQASSGWFYKNFHGLIENNPNTTIHALDMIGHGLSSEPINKIKDETNKKAINIIFDDSTIENIKHIHKSLYLPKRFTIDTTNYLNFFQNQYQLIEQIENEYVESIENWRKLNQIDQFDLIGHSLGGYVSLCYAMKYPDNIKKLILVSPGGIERSPFAIANPRIQELRDLQVINHLPDKIEFNCSYSVEDYSFLGRLPIIRRFFKWFWMNKLSLQDYLRIAGPFGPKILSKNHFKKLARPKVIDKFSEINLLTSYIYQTFFKRKFGDTAIQYIFTSSIVAKYPMLDRIHNLNPKINTLWLYGQHDWMYSDCGKAACKILNRIGSKSEFDLISKSGHNVYLDNSIEFNSKVKNFLNLK
ncbi:hypothetical protein BVG19_g376 [[Candida] boidinii]|nr:hypothetical protein BVG19_g376 [[Candida] boidinii]OWB49565.1 hypothetical protein B5S27_g1106 [[Candida] boidinii]